jgi:hypothetical protein
MTYIRFPKGKGFSVFQSDRTDPVSIQTGLLSQRTKGESKSDSNFVFTPTGLPYVMLLNCAQEQLLICLCILVLMVCHIWNCVYLFKYSKLGCCKCKMKSERTAKLPSAQHEGTWGNGSITPLFLNVSIKRRCVVSLTPWRLYPLERSLDGLHIRYENFGNKNLAENRTPAPPVHSLVTIPSTLLGSNPQTST